MSEFEYETYEVVLKSFTWKINDLFWINFDYEKHEFVLFRNTNQDKIANQVIFIFFFIFHCYCVLQPIFPFLGKLKNNFSSNVFINHKFTFQIALFQNPIQVLCQNILGLYLLIHPTVKFNFIPLIFSFYFTLWNDIVSFTF